MTTAKYMREWRARNNQKNREFQKRYRLKHPEKMKECRDNWRNNNKEHAKSLEISWREKNRENIKRRKAFRYANDLDVRAMHSRWSSERRAVKKKSIPEWANDFFIQEIYHLAALRTKIMGYKWHVDHIVPLQSKLVCGLHVENNLQVIPSERNQSKNNRYWPEMP